MEQVVTSDIHETNEDNMGSGSAEFASPECSAKDKEQSPVTVEKKEASKDGIKGTEAMTQSSGSSHVRTTGDVNMEASITSDDVARAGGLGARDDIGSFLPVAMDSTDFEASLRDARDYEEPQGQMNRPGIGWSEAMEAEER